MKKKILSTAFLFIFLSVFALGEDSDPLGALIGTYQGKVFSGDKLIPVMTTLKYSEENGLTGTYAMGEEDGFEIGTLTGFELQSPFVVLCTWQDKYGSGKLRILFSADLSSFQGYWGLDDATLLPWSGTKK